jgi:hypothetical protein
MVFIAIDDGSLIELVEGAQAINEIVLTIHLNTNVVEAAALPPPFK